jgi:hypothetical protein
MAKLDRDGVKIHYEVHGSGPTLLLSHGYSSTARMWDGQIAAPDRYQIVVWISAGTASLTIQDQAHSEALTVGDMRPCSISWAPGRRSSRPVAGGYALAFTSHPTG